MCFKPIYLDEFLDEETGEYRQGMVVPCGRCLECQQRIRNWWTIRIMEEEKVSNSAKFITLTYNQEHIPFDYMIDKKDIQDFIKRLRYYEKKAKNSMKIKYFACGEYGSENYRPHYHLALFNSDPENVLKAWTSKGKEIGNIYVGEVTQASANYLTKYMINEDEDDNLRSFRLMSKGLGESYINKQRNYHRNNLIPDYTFNDGRKTFMPRYYREKIFNTDSYAETTKIKVNGELFKRGYLHEEWIKEKRYEKDLSYFETFKGRPDWVEKAEKELLKESIDHRKLRLLGKKLKAKQKSKSSKV